MIIIPLSKPSITEIDILACNRVLHSGMLVQGKEVEKFENDISEYFNIKHAICASSGTATLHLCLTALGIGPGDEVIVPAFSYIATANVVELTGAKPIFVDIDLETFNINSNRIESAITKKTKAIIPVHEFGLCAEISEISKIAEQHNLLLIEDAACALGAKENDQFAGLFGTFGSFSLHPRKAITSGEGGIVTTNDDMLAKKIRVLRNHGIEMKEGTMHFVAAGFNYRMTDFQAALVGSQFSRLNSIIESRQRLAEVYLNLITTNKVSLPTIPIGKNHTWQTFHLLTSTNEDRNRIQKYLETKGVMSNYGAQCIPHMKYYHNKYNFDSKILFPNAFKAYTCGLAIPMFDQLSVNKAKYISETINKFR